VISINVLITGATGQLGHYLIEKCLEKKYNVNCLVRRVSDNTNLVKLKQFGDSINLIEGDITDINSIYNSFKCDPDIVFHLAAQSHVGKSWNQSHLTFNTNVIGMLNLITVLKEYDEKRIKPRIKLVNMSSSEMYGRDGVFNEDSKFTPKSNYGVSKLAAHEIVRINRNAFGVFGVNIISNNYESPYRSEEFVTRKITKAVASIKKGETDKLELGLLTPKRDWSHASDVADALFIAVSQDKPDDYVVSSGEMHSVEEFVKTAFEIAGLNWTDYVKINQKLFRPNEIMELTGDSSKLRKLGWKPKYNFRKLIEEMVKSDLR